MYHLFWFLLSSLGFRQEHKTGHSVLFLRTVLGPAGFLSDVLLSVIPPVVATLQAPGCLGHSKGYSWELGAAVVRPRRLLSPAAKAPQSVRHLEQLFCFEKWLVLSFQEGTACVQWGGGEWPW